MKIISLRFVCVFFMYEPIESSIRRDKLLFLQSLKTLEQIHNNVLKTNDFVMKERIGKS